MDLSEIPFIKDKKIKLLIFRNSQLRGRKNPIIMPFTRVIHTESERRTLGTHRDFYCLTCGREHEIPEDAPIEVEEPYTCEKCGNDLAYEHAFIIHTPIRHGQLWVIWEDYNMIGEGGPDILFENLVELHPELKEVDYHKDFFKWEVEKYGYRACERKERTGYWEGYRKVKLTPKA
ncbi:hypothetical protein CMI47_21505 [Candidatus Pacearchaeota archaeon]|jgi:predicted RNA-binding Zn-ribbon protein involved in translation (DUF1610 family)|nr:hypothetical protein [Candidatus Pacearchaeota archaeon]|tara:strand:+ start:1505 stop:2032 length:528 start_codon:yes stop_codon:yes gene_type:complete